MSIHAVNQLRQSLRECQQNKSSFPALPILEHYADEIEAEVAEYFTKLPTDDAGVPIHLGDKLTLGHNGNVVTVRSLELMNGRWHIWPVEDGGPFTSDNPCTHYERTVEDVLQDFVDKILDEGRLNVFAREHWGYDPTDEIKERIEQLKRECAADIREVMK